MTDELSPEREERLIAEMLRERGAIDPAGWVRSLTWRRWAWSIAYGGTRALRAGTPRAVCTTAT